MKGISPWYCAGTRRGTQWQGYACISVFLLCFVTWCFCFRVVVLLWCFLLISLVLLFLCKGVSDVFSRFFSVMSQSVQRCFRFATQISCTRKQFNKRPLPDACSRNVSKNVFKKSVHARTIFPKNSFLKRDVLKEFVAGSESLTGICSQREQHLIPYNYI